jgi:Fe-S oxidoreductase
MTLVLVLGLLINAVALPIAGRRVVFLYRLITSGQPAPDRLENLTSRTAVTIRNQLVEVLGQRKLLKWSVPGAAHAFVMYAFLILATVYLEAYGVLLSTNPHWAIPVIGHWAVLGFLQDFIAVMCVVGLATFAIIRLKNAPERLGRKSRFKGSHLGGAWLVLVMIFNVIWTMLLFRGAAAAAGNLPYKKGAFASIGIGKLLDGLPENALETLEHVGLLLHIGVMLVFLVIVLNSKHLHIFIAPLNVMFKREPVALGAALPMMSNGKPLDFENLDEMDEDAVMGVGKIEDFSWKGMLDFASCTECGRCQSQCPAWNTEKPLSPKMLIMGLRDHAFAKAPYMLADSDEKRAALPAEVLAEAERPLVGPTEGEAWHPTGGAVIDPDVLWSCTSCGACVEQCPVDIEHVDHIIDMRRYQVLIESNFPSELNGLFKGLENKGNPWNMNPQARMEWAQGLDFPVKVVGEDVEALDEVEWLFWVGCAGAYEDRAKKTTRAVAELLDLAGVSFAVLGNGETCTGDSARRSGNEFVFQQLAMENIEKFKETKVKKVVSTCAHCFNTLKNEYSQLGIELEVVHHTQLLNRLVREGKLTPVPDTSAPKKTITYHDPCYLGRHNQVYTPPRELLSVIPNAEVKEMERNSERSFCCGAGGARMWMEETIGERINENRTIEAVGTGADQIATGCPFCRVMLDDGLTKMQSEGNAREEVEVLDVAQLLLAGVKRAQAAPAPEGDATPETDKLF